MPTLTPRKYYRYPDLNEREQARKDMIKAYPQMRFNWQKLQDEDTKIMQLSFWGGCWAIDPFMLEDELRRCGIMREDEFLDNDFYARFEDGEYKAEITNALVCPIK